MAKPSRSNANQGTPRSKSGGGFLLGMFVGLIVGLAVALGIAFYLNKTPIPFMTKKPVAESTLASRSRPPKLSAKDCRSSDHDSRNIRSCMVCAWPCQ